MHTSSVIGRVLVASLGTCRFGLVVALLVSTSAADERPLPHLPDVKPISGAAAVAFENHDLVRSGHRPWSHDQKKEHGKWSKT